MQNMQTLTEFKENGKYLNILLKQLKLGEHKTITKGNY